MLAADLPFDEDCPHEQNECHQEETELLQAEEEDFPQEEGWPEEWG